MKISNNYKYITGMFNTPVVYSKPPLEHPFRTIYSFKVGNCEYKLAINKITTDVYSVMFELVDMDASPREMIKLIERVTKKPYILNDNSDLYQDFKNTIHINGFKILGVGSASVLLGQVIQILNQFRRSHIVRCYVFSADEESRVSIYTKLIKRFINSGTVETEGDDIYKMFKVCFN